MKYYEDYIASHRCPESLKQHASVRKMKGWNKDSPTTWYVGNLTLDSEWGVTHMEYNTVGVSYCPYCGKKLEEEC